MVLVTCVPQYLYKVGCSGVRDIAGSMVEPITNLRHED